MKKILLSLIVVSFICLLTGCGSKTLTCSKTSTEDGITSKTNYTVDFDGEEPSKVTAKIEMQMPNELKNYMSIYEEAMKSAFKDKKGIDFDIESKDTNLTVKLVIEPKEMDTDALESMDLDAGDFKGNYDSIKNEMVKDGYTCK